jgi:hypothetical protein
MPKKLDSAGPPRVSPVLFDIDPHSNTKSPTYVHIKIKNNKEKAIVDSGADTTLISKKLVNKLNINYKTDNQKNTRFLSASGGELNTVGHCIIDIMIGKIKIRQLCTVIENLSTNILLGTDLLTNYGATINFKDKTMSIGKNTVNIHTAGSLSNHCLTAKSNIMIPAKGKRIM